MEIWTLRRWHFNSLPLVSVCPRLSLYFRLKNNAVGFKRPRYLISLQMPERRLASWDRCCVSQSVCIYWGAWRAFVTIGIEYIWWTSLCGDDKTTNDQVCFCCSVFFSLPALTRSRLWPVPSTLPPCVAVMETPTPTSVPCVSKDSEYTQLLHSQHVRQRKTETPSRLLVVNEFNGPQSQDSTRVEQSSQLTWGFYLLGFTGNEPVVISQY